MRCVMAETAATEMSLLKKLEAEVRERMSEDPKTTRATIHKRERAIWGTLRALEELRKGAGDAQG